MNTPAMDLRNVDLNLLFVFGVIYRMRNITRAASALHLTQPAVSNALKRLREQFDDVLFVKAVNGMAPTPTADRIADLLEEGFASLRLALRAGQPFDPRTATRTFRLYVSDIGQAVFVPSLAARLGGIAPGLRLITIYVPLEAAQQMMMLGDLDLAIGIFSELHGDFIQQRLFHETYAVLVRKDHPNIGAAISKDQFFAADHVIYTPTAGSHARLEMELNAQFARNGHARKAVLQLAHSTGIDRIVASSTLIACVPSSVASAMADQEGLRVLPLPFDMTPIDVSQFWHERFHRDEGHQWLRSLIFEMFHDRRQSAIK